MYVLILYFIEVIIQQQSDDIEVLKEEIYKYQHSSGKWNFRFLKDCVAI